ncbi:MAG TPA: STAS domain-containing protein [Labilithrix sp.]|nr:STAS domain-containing protein [Labilithrix sp.]
MSEDLHEQIALLRSQLATAQKKAARVLARHQQHALAMEVLRQKNDELDALTAELNAARSAEAERARELERANEKLRDRERENRELIGRLQELVGQLSIPILRVRQDALALPIIGALDEQRAVAITTRLLEKVSAMSAACVIIDLTGVDIVDAPTAEHLLNIARATKLLGARCVLCGIQPSVANRMMEHGLDLSEIETVRNLHLALDLTRDDGNARRPAVRAGE